MGLDTNIGYTACFDDVYRGQTIMGRFKVFFVLVFLTGCAGMDIEQILAGQLGPGSRVSVAEGIKHTLELGSQRAANELSRPGGYADNPLFRIDLPQNLQPLANSMRQVGLGRHVDQLEGLMNQGAELAAAESHAIFRDAIRNMTIDDALGIIRGPEDAATQYFRQQTETRLRSRYQPIINNQLQQVGFYEQYRSMLDIYNTLPIARRVNLDLESYVLTQSMDSLFRRIAMEEALIRDDPLGRGSEVIASVFGRR